MPGSPTSSDKPNLLLINLTPEFMSGSIEVE